MAHVLQYTISTSEVNMKTLAYKITKTKNFETDDLGHKVFLNETYQLIFSGYVCSKNLGWLLDVEIPLKKTCTLDDAYNIAEYHKKRPELLEKFNTGLDSLMIATK